MYDINAIKKPTEPSVPLGISSGFVHTVHKIIFYMIAISTKAPKQWLIIFSFSGSPAS